MKPNQTPPANSSAPKPPTSSAAPESALPLTAPVVPPAAPVPPDAEAKAKADAEAKAKADAEAKAKQRAELLPQIVAGARDALGHALRVMIANQLPEGDGGRRITENAFEAAKNLCQTPAKATRKDVADALDGLTVAVGYLANHSLRLPEDLNTARAAQHKLTKLAEQYDTLAA